MKMNLKIKDQRPVSIMRYYPLPGTQQFGNDLFPPLLKIVPKPKSESMIGRIPPIPPHRQGILEFLVSSPDIGQPVDICRVFTENGQVLAIVVQLENRFDLIFADGGGGCFINKNGNFMLPQDYKNYIVAEVIKFCWR